MERRKFLSLIPAGALTIPLLFREGVDCQAYHRGFALYWTGWKNAVNLFCLCGQWFAENQKAKWMAYASTPGVESWAVRGTMIDMSFQPGQEVPGPSTDEAALNRMKGETKKRLVAYIDCHYEALMRGGVEDFR